MQVPILNQQINQSPIQLKQQSASDATFGGNASQAIDQISNNFQKSLSEVAKIKDEADDIRVKSAYYSLLKHKSDLIYNPQDGVTTKFGKDALGIQPEYLKRFKNYADTLSKDLTPTQQLKFKTLQDREMVDFNETLDKHFFVENRKFELQTIDSGLEVHSNEIVNKYLQGKNTDFDYQEMKSLLDKKSSKLGMDNATKTIEESKHYTNIHSNIIEALVNRDDDISAKEYFDKNKDKISVDQLDRLEKLIKQSSTIQESKRLADNILVQYSGDPVRALNEAKKIKNAKLSDAVTDRVKQQFANDKAAREYEQEELYNTGLQAMKNSGKPSIKEMYESIPLSIQAKIDNKTKKLLVSQFNDPVNNDQKWLKFQTLTHKELSDLSELQFRDYWSEFDAERRTKAENIWREAKKNVLNPSESRKFKSMISDNELLLWSLAQNKIAGIEAGDKLTDVLKSKQKATAFNELQYNLNKRMEDYYNQKGVNPSYEEKEKMIKSLFVMKEGLFTDKSTPIYKIEKGDAKDYYVPIESIPPEHQRRIILKIKELNPQLSQLSDEQIIKGMKRNIERAYLQATTNQPDELLRSTLKYKK